VSLWPTHQEEEAAWCEEATSPSDCVCVISLFCFLLQCNVFALLSSLVLTFGLALCSCY
jgi:hypothetical protein